VSTVLQIELGRFSQTLTAEKEDIAASVPGLAVVAPQVLRYGVNGFANRI